MPNLTDKQLQIARFESPLFMANINTKGKLKLSTPLSFFEKNFNTDFEELGCIGYNPNSEELTAIIKIKRSTGYSGNLCSKGSFEYVRFYVDFGAGYQDQGVVGVNVHDIPTGKDCAQKDEKPIEFAVRLKIDPKNQICSKPFLPKVKAVLLWQTVPPANDPNLVQPGYVWGNVKETRIQIKPFKLTIANPGFISIIEKAVLNPNVSLANLALSNPLIKKDIATAKNAIVGEKVIFSELVKQYNADKVKIEPERIGFKFISEALNTKDAQVVKNSNEVFKLNNLDYTKAISAILATKGNTTYEELGCVGYDYESQLLVATFNAKKNYGYGGNLCSAGSKEYVTFWMQDESTNCEWKKLGTSVVELHDIPGHTGISYSAMLSYNFNAFKNPCNQPKVIKIRAVLSWNVEPTGLDTPYWGNSKESYILLQPKISLPAGNAPQMIRLGGIHVISIDDVSGLTSANAFFRNGLTVDPGYSFSGRIEMTGISAEYAGMKYRIKIMSSLGEQVYTKPFTVAKRNPLNPFDVTTITADSDGFYTYQTFNNNPDGIIALMDISYNEVVTIKIEHQNGTSYSHALRLDNEGLTKKLNVNDDNSCVHYEKGGDILGVFSAADNFLKVYHLSVNGGEFVNTANVPIGNVISGTSNVLDKPFKIKTATDKNCGMIYLTVIPKNVVHSAWVSPGETLPKQFCLKDKTK